MNDAGLRRLLERATVEPPADLEARVFRARRHPWRWTAAAAALVLVAGALGWSLAREPGDEVTAGLAPSCVADEDGPGSLVSLSVASGSERWSRRVGHRTSAAQHDGVIAAVGKDGGLLGIDAATGATRWCRELVSGSGVFTEPLVVVADGTFVVMRKGRLTSVTSSGEVRWERSFGTSDSHDRAIEVAAGEAQLFLLLGGPTVYVLGIPTVRVGEDREPVPPVIVAVDAATGEVDPRAPHPFEGRPGPGGLIHESTRVLDRQETRIGIAGPSGEERWSKVVPGFSVMRAEEMVIVIDQTGGTGVVPDTLGRPDSNITAYAVLNGSKRWNLGVPGTPQRVFDAGSGRVVVADEAEVIAIDLSSGTKAWSSDVGSPGMNQRYSEPGNYTWFDHADGAIVGLIVAAEPYRD
jgi:outer membrane protein assembly factor BamB